LQTLFTLQSTIICCLSTKYS